MTGLLTYEQFRAIRDAAALAFCESEIATYTPVEAEWAAEVSRLIKAIQKLSKRDQNPATDALKAAGERWRDASTRLHAAQERYEVLTASHKLPTEVVSFQDVKAHWNAAAQKWDDPRFVYIGRGNKAYNLPTSPYANPFKLESEQHRGATLGRYRQWLDSRIHALDLEALRGKVLVCWCKDKSHPDRPCHGDVLVEALDVA